MRNIVMFSGGVGSWATAKRVAERHGTDNLTLLFADTKVEDPDEQIDRRVLEAVRLPRRIREIAEHVNENRPGWDTLTDYEVAKVLVRLHEDGLVVGGRAGYWRAIKDDEEC